MLFYMLMRLMSCRYTISATLCKLPPWFGMLGEAASWWSDRAFSSSQSRICFIACFKNQSMFIDVCLRSDWKRLNTYIGHISTTQHIKPEYDYSPGVGAIPHFRWFRRRGLGVAALVFHRAHNVEVASVSTHATNTNWFLTSLVQRPPQIAPESDSCKFEHRNAAQEIATFSDLIEWFSTCCRMLP